MKTSSMGRVADAAGRAASKTSRGSGDLRTPAGPPGRPGGRWDKASGEERRGHPPAHAGAVVQSPGDGVAGGHREHPALVGAPEGQAVDVPQAGAAVLGPAVL